MIPVSLDPKLQPQRKAAMEKKNWLAPRSSTVYGRLGQCMSPHR